MKELALANIKQKKIIVLTTCIGSLLEMYDFVIYGFFATIIAKQFFPPNNMFISLLATFGIFAIGYFARPLGGLIFGHLSDRLGRKSSLVYSVASMGIPIFIIGLLPTYQTIGDAAPILLLICRIIQGLSVGGEFPGAITFLTEHAPQQSRGYTASWVFFGINLGVVVASFLGAIITALLPNSQLEIWGWRIPFILGGIIALLGYYIRKNIAESPLYVQMKKKHLIMKNPVAETFKTSKLNLIKGFGLISVMAAAIGTIFLFMPTYLTYYLKINFTTALWINAFNVLIFTLLIPFMAILSDKVGRKPVLVIGTLLFIFNSYPLFLLLPSNNHYLVMWALACLGALASFIVGPIASTLAELFATNIRTTGIAIAYNLSFGLFGGLAPLLITALIKRTHNMQSPAIYLSLTAFISLLFMLSLQETKGKSLD
ncbi:MAG: hypothetical protein A3E87_09445 [Gammaproteobacteria bacterium RIFCSPHIGHO2_12_FULL_35_23]|nr:MAG: hypothetical protein A3E87_09445 [Gammaproteobacteria bacterium RIFCSPHIGHO2_12_FULL_35_23]